MSAFAPTAARPVPPPSPHDPPEAPGPEIPIAYNVSVGDVMSRDPVSIGPEASLFDALVLMRTYDVTGLPVVDPHGQILGVVSQKDLARSVSVPADLPDVKGLLDVLMLAIRDQPVALLSRLRSALELLPVRTAMSRPPFTVRSDAPLELAMRVMADHAISRLPVVEEGKLVGIVTPTDLISAALRSASRAPSER